MKMDQNPTKYYSCKQEHMIAEYLGWDVVPGSGARDFHPGDIRSDCHLGECKTHTKSVNDIKFYSRVWNKIQHEAESEMRCPVLFTDNGTQKIENTWCVLPKRCVNILTLECVHNPDIKHNKSGIVIKHKYMKDTLHYSYAIIVSDFPDVSYPVVIMSLPTFKCILDGDL